MQEQFINLKSMSKTLKFSLLPVGKTQEHFANNKILENDKNRAHNYLAFKEIADNYYKIKIEECLKGKNLNSDKFNEFVSNYTLYHDSKTDKGKKSLDKSAAELRKSILEILKPIKPNKDKNKEFVSALQKYLENNECPENDISIVKGFDRFVTYLSPYFTNRNNMFSDEEKHTAISYRIVNENLPIFIENSKNFETILAALPQEDFDELNANFKRPDALTIEQSMTLDTYNFPLAQSGIDEYNNVIGGYSLGNGTKVKGINEYVNLYNQKLSKADKKKRLPRLKKLYKQILSDKGTASFIPESFENDNEVLEAINKLYAGIECDIAKITELLKNIDMFSSEGIFITSRYLNNVSKSVFDNWTVIKHAWFDYYDKINDYDKKKKKARFSQENYNSTRNKAYKKIESFSIANLEELGVSTSKLYNYYKEQAEVLKNSIDKSFNDVRTLISNKYRNSTPLFQDKANTERIKSFLDSIKSFESFAKPLLGSGTEESRDNAFYNEFETLFQDFQNFNKLYNKVRNYATKKPYSTKKIKLTFGNSSFLSGWSNDSYTKSKAFIVQKSNKYYLVICETNLQKEDIEFLKENPGEDLTQMIVYNNKSLDTKNFKRLFLNDSKDGKAIQYYHFPVDSIKGIYDSYTAPEGDSKRIVDPIKRKEALIKIIDYFKSCLSIHESTRDIEFNFKPSDEYSSLPDFYNDAKSSCYWLDKEDINFAHLMQLVEDGRLYLFQIYNKDFSDKSHGTPNLHTMFFKAIFDEDNLNQIVYKLSGGAEMFYREASLSPKITHPKNQPIKNKNELNSKKESVFNYDLIKDKRYTTDQFSLHFPIEVNYLSDNKTKLNDKVIDCLRKSEKTHIIGIDRGERNLIYISVIDENANIIEQKSFNLISSGNGYTVDYHDLLDKREKERDVARKSWQTVGNIKNLKEGFISLVVHEICQLAIKYDAIIALEDLNCGFKNNRKRIEKQVYQKFENMLISKLSYCVDKTIDPHTEGGLYRAYQLAEDNDKKQKGIILYVPAYLTSKIDPVTGFADFVCPYYKNVEESIKFFSLFDDIRYNDSSDMFEFDIDYSKFSKGYHSYRKNWTVCTNGQRILTFKNKEANVWDSEEINLTDRFKALFDKFSINYKENLKESIINQNSKEFFEELTKLLKLALQMRNSKTGTDIDYLISPVRDSNGNFFDSRNYTPESNLPCDADANGAYNIARKALWSVNKLKENAQISKTPYISNTEWMEYTQNQ